MDLMSAEGFAWEAIERLAGADRLTGCIRGGGRGCFRLSNGDGYSNGGNKDNGRGLGGFSYNGVGGEKIPSISNNS